jgi:beta-phosphoglucomutase
VDEGNNFSSGSKSMKAVLFDYDGTLVDSMDQHFSAWKTVFNKYGIEFSGNDFYPYEGEKLNHLVRRIFPKCNDVNALILEKDNLYVRTSEFRIYDGVESFITHLKKNTIKVGIVTAGRLERIKNTAPEWFVSLFDTIVSHGDTERGKPFPDPYLTGAKKLDVDIGDCIVVENAPLGIQSANAAGAKSIGITSTVDSETLKDATIVIERFSELKNVEEFRTL